MHLTIVARALPTRGKIHVGLQERRDAVGLAIWRRKARAIRAAEPALARHNQPRTRRGGFVERFVYLTYGDVGDREFTMRGRAKLMLDDAPTVDAAAAVTVTVTVEVTDSDGRVRTARLRPPVAVWTVD
jgi:hypothetical protein